MIPHWDSVVPGKHLRKSAVAVSKGERASSWPMDRRWSSDITIGQLEIMGDIAGTTLVFGPDDAEPILGVTALEWAGNGVEPRNQRLKRLPASPLK